MPKPVGFYAPAQIVRDAQQHGVEIRLVCINESRWDCTLEPREVDDARSAVRLGLRMVKGLGNAEAARLIAAGPINVMCRSMMSDAELRSHPLHSSNSRRRTRSDHRSVSRGALRYQTLRDEPLPLFTAAARRETLPIAEQSEPVVSLKPMTAGSEVVEDYGHVGLTLRQHPAAVLRSEVGRGRILTCADAVASRDRRWVDVAGLVLVRQRPGSAKGVMFMTIEDETSVANLMIWQAVFEKYRRVVLGAGLIGVKGRVQREGEVIHIVAQHLTDLRPSSLVSDHGDAAFPLPHGRGDAFHHGPLFPDPRGLPKSEESRRSVWAYRRD